jgi:hypothetical protein
MTVLRDLLDRAGDSPYRDLIQHHIRKQSFKQLGQGLLGTAALLPENMQAKVADYIDRINQSLGYDQEFWRQATVKYALDRMIGGIAPFVFPLEDAPNFHLRVIRGEDAELAFNIFQIATLNFAASACQTPAQRKFMGIKKGWFS